MWFKLYKVGFYIFLIFVLSACANLSRENTITPKKTSVLDFNEFDNPSENKSDTVDVGSGLSGEDLMTSEQKKKYVSLQKEKEQLESWIDNKERERMSIQVERMRPIGPDYGGVRGSSIGSAGLVSNDPQLGAVDRYNATNKSRETVDLTKLKLKRLDWQEEECTNEIKVFKHDLGVVESKIDRLKNEAKKSCFSSDTNILLANGKSKKISKIKIGDKIMAFDIAKDEISADAVKQVYISENNHMYVINDTIRATAYERFLTKDRGWIKIRDLKLGDEIFDGNSYQKIVSLHKIKKFQKVYNLNIVSKNNFFASNKNGIYFLIHNCGGDSGGGK